MCLPVTSSAGASAAPYTPSSCWTLLEQALRARQPPAGCLDPPFRTRGAQYVSIRYTERLAEAGIETSVGSKGDSYDNALAETINGLYKAG